VSVRRRSALGLAALFALAGCGSSSSGRSTGSVGPAAPPLSSTGKPVPAPLDQLEAEAEDIGDQVPSGAWDQIANDVKTVTESWTAYRAQAAADGAPADLAAALTKAISELSTASAAKQGAATSQAANDVSAAVAELFGVYDIGRPVSIGRLDVIGRQIALDAAARDQSGVVAQIGRARSEWTTIEDDVKGHQGGDVAKKTDTTLDALTESADAGDFKTVTTQANALLELVDDMEGLY
jgi:hypothetical protein